MRVAERAAPHVRSRCGVGGRLPSALLMLLLLQACRLLLVAVVAAFYCWLPSAKWQPLSPGYVELCACRLVGFHFEEVYILLSIFRQLGSAPTGRSCKRHRSPGAFFLPALNEKESSAQLNDSCVPCNSQPS